MRQIRHIVVGTERSLTPCPAMDLAAEMANRYGAELDIIRVLLPSQPPGTEAGQADAMRASQVAEKLRQLAAGLAGPRGHARVIVDADPAMAIVRAAEEIGADLLVVGNIGMVGEVGPELRELLILMLMAFWQEDVTFLSDVVLMIAGWDQRPDLDIAAFQAELGELLARYRHLSLKEMQLGPILQEITEISIRHDVPLPASLALTGKALAQVQLVITELDPTLDPFAVAGHFLRRKFRDEVKGRIDPQKLFYESQKLRMRTVRFVESVERLTGARPGPKLQVNFRGTERLEDNIRRAGQRLSLSLVAGALWIGTAFAAGSAHVATWVPPSLAGLGGVLTLGLGIDLLRRRRA